jgi:hypothetical protein
MLSDDLMVILNNLNHGYQVQMSGQLFLLYYLQNIQSERILDLSSILFKAF